MSKIKEIDVMQFSRWLKNTKRLPSDVVNGLEMQRFDTLKGGRTWLETRKIHEFDLLSAAIYSVRVESYPPTFDGYIQQKNRMPSLRSFGGFVFDRDNWVKMLPSYPDTFSVMRSVCMFIADKKLFNSL